MIVSRRVTPESQVRAPNKPLDLHSLFWRGHPLLVVATQSLMSKSSLEDCETQASSGGRAEAVLDRVFQQGSDQMFFAVMVGKIGVYPDRWA